MDIRGVARELNALQQQMGQGYADGESAGVVSIPAGEASTTTPLFVFVTPDGTVLGALQVYWSAAGNVAWVSLNTNGISSGDVAYSQLQATRQNGTSQASAQVSSEGEFSVYLVTGHVTTDGSQRMRVRTAHSSSNTSPDVMTIETERSSGATAAGFGGAFSFYAANASGNQTWQGGIGSAFVGGTTNSNITIAAQNLVKISNGAGAPSVTGSRGGNAALASLLTTLATIGLITDNTTV